MNRIVFHSRVGSDGTLQLTVPVGPADANQEVQVTVEPIAQPSVSPEEWRQFVLSTAGAWQGEFERSEGGVLEERESLCENGVWNG